LVRVAGCGLCHTDLHYIDHGVKTFKPPPLILGHEAAGVVAELGPGVTGRAVGDRVLIPSVLGCGQCDYCRQGRENLCSQMVMLGNNIDGAYAELVVVPAKDLLLVPEELPLERACVIADALSTPFHAVRRRAKVRLGESVVVVGCGGVGLNVVQGAKLAGAKTIIACDLLDNKLEYAREFGATHTINATSQNVVEQVRALTGGRGADYAFDAIGGEATTLQIIDAIRPGGTAVIVGMAAMNVRAPITPYMMALQEKTLRGTMYGSVRPNIDFPRLVDLYLDGRLKIDQLVSRTYKLAEINEGFAALRSGQVARGVVVF
jgi:Zn-dependent alcohol dehydrogenase